MIGTSSSVQASDLGAEISPLLVTFGETVLALERAVPFDDPLTDRDVDRRRDGEQVRR
jgi:hypothetical protein